jgi:1-phosphofructokinase family hexose kinase
MINTLTLNPAIDKVIFLDKLEKNVTNRVEKVSDVIGGKGTHVSINLKLLGLNNRAFGIGYGAQGRRIVDILQSYGLETEFVLRDNHESRTNYLLIEGCNDCTLISEKGVLLEEEDLAEVMSRMQEKVGEGDFLILSGDASNSTDPFVYNRILKSLKSKNLKVFLDTSGQSLLKCADEAPYLIKPNLDELSMLCGREVGLAEGDLLQALDSLDRFGIEVIAVSLGGEGSIVKCPEGVFRVWPPAVKVKNTIGCGDCFLAGLVYGIEKSLSIVDALKLATAASAATAESALSVGFDRERAESLVAACEIHRVR